MCIDRQIFTQTTFYSHVCLDVLTWPTSSFLSDIALLFLFFLVFSFLLLDFEDTGEPSKSTETHMES